MAKKPSGGDLFYKVGLEAHVANNSDSPIDYGNTEDAWAEQFVTRAEFINVRGREEVLAARLTGTHVQVIRVRASSLTRAITTAWRAVDKRNGDIFNIRDVTVETDRQFISLLTEKGVAT